MLRAVKLLIYQSRCFSKIRQILLRKPIFGKLLSRLLYFFFRNVRIVKGREMKRSIVGVFGLQIIQIIKMIETFRG